MIELNDRPIALEAYEQLAEAFAAHVETEPHSARRIMRRKGS